MVRGPKGQGLFSLFYIVFSSFLDKNLVASRQVPSGQLPPDNSPAIGNLSSFGTCTGGNCLLWNLSTWKHVYPGTCPGGVPKPSTRRALRNPPNDKYSPNVGSLYPIQMNLGSFLENPPPPHSPQLVLSGTCPGETHPFRNLSTRELVYPGTCLPRNLSRGNMSASLSCCFWNCIDPNLHI